MKKVLIVYFSTAGATEKMAGYIAEGVRFSGQEAAVKKIADVKTSADILDYDGYILGSPTFSLDVPAPVKAFLAAAEKVSLAGKLGGTFGSYRHDVSYKHDNHAPAIILGSLERVHKMRPFELGPLIMKEDMIDTSEGMKACQDYGKVFGEKLGA